MILSISLSVYIIIYAGPIYGQTSTLLGSKYSLVGFMQICEDLMTHLCGDKESAAIYYEVIIYSQLLVNIPVAVCVVWGTHLI